MSENKKSIEELEAELEALKKQHEEEKGVLLDSNKELQEELQHASETIKEVKKTVTINKVTYEIIPHKIKVDDKVYSADELAKDKELVKKLVELGSGAIRPLKK